MRIYLTTEVTPTEFYTAARNARMHTENTRHFQPRGGGFGISFSGYGSDEVHSHRRPNDRGRNGWGAYAASWDQWGVLLANLFAIDPDMVVGSVKHPTYDGAEHFHRLTDGRFRDVVTLDDLPDFHGDHTFRYRPELGSMSSSVHACTKCSALQVRGY